MTAVFTVETEAALYQANDLTEAMQLWAASIDDTKVIVVNRLG